MYPFYRFGSENSLDIDIFYVFPEVPSIQECRAFCDQTDENRNIIQIENGMVVNCFKGTPDETHNALYYTYHLHPQDFPMPLNGPQIRQVIIKTIRAIRIVLSYFTRSKDRKQIKEALTSYQQALRIETLKQLDFMDYEMSADLRKSVAFQLGQTLALINGKEIYTKNSLAAQYPTLSPFMQRQEGTNPEVLNQFKSDLIKALEGVEISSANKVDYFLLSEGRITTNEYQKQAIGVKVNIHSERLQLD